LRYVIICHGKLNELAGIAEILFDRYVMNPGLERSVEKLQPLVAHMKHDGIAQKQMLETKASCHAAEIKQILKLAMILEPNLLGRLGTQRVRV
jgi:hypothetical protein